MPLVFPKKVMVCSGLIPIETIETDMNRVESGHFTLSVEQRQFKLMLSTYPKFTPYWDFDRRSCDLDAIKRDIVALSHGERIMLQFFVAVWLGENKGFDLIDAAKTLDEDQLQVIISWLNKPMFP